jgi:hypothetical protein
MPLGNGGSGSSGGIEATGDDSGGGGSSGASSSGGASSGSASGSGGSTSGSGGTSSGCTMPGCIGQSALAALGKNRLVVGVSTGDAPTVKAAPFDIRYVYISGGLFDGPAPCASCASNCSTAGKMCANSAGGCAWWGCYQYDQNPPGEYVRDFISAAKKASPVQIPMFTYYELLQAYKQSGGTEGAAEVTSGATSTSIMTKYWNDWRFLLKQIGNDKAILHIEPDFWGYAEQLNADPTKESAAVASANSTDCSSTPNTIAGMGQCMIAMARKYAPNALVGLHASAWSTKIDVEGNTSPSLDIAGEAKKTATFLSACGESAADLVIVETSDRDAGYYQSQGHPNAFWDVTNMTLPDFHQDFAWVTALTEALGKPALYWQMPLGNANQNNTKNHWKDNRLDYFFAHESELAAAHAIGACYGAGAGDQTLPETDGGNLVAKTKAYVAAGGQAL